MKCVGKRKLTQKKIKLIAASLRSLQFMFLVTLIKKIREKTQISNLRNKVKILKTLKIKMITGKYHEQLLPINLTKKIK